MARRTNTTQHHQQRPASARPNNDQQRMGRYTPHSIVHYILSFINTLSKHHAFSQASTLAKHHMPLFQALPEKHHMFVLNKTFSHVSASAKTSSHKTVSRKISQDTTETPKKPKIFTSPMSVSQCNTHSVPPQWSLEFFQHCSKAKFQNVF